MLARIKTTHYSLQEIDTQDCENNKNREKLAVIDMRKQQRVKNISEKKTINLHDVIIDSVTDSPI